MLSELWAAEYSPERDTFLSTYAQTAATIGLTPELKATLPLSRDAIGLLLAECYQESGHLDKAVDVVEQLEPSAFAATSLADLYAAQQRWDEIVALTESVTNEDDFSAFLLVQRGVAFRQQGYHAAARESFKLALARKARSESIRHLALIERSATYRAEGKKAMARKDLERVLSEDSRRPGIRDLIAQIDT